MKNNELTLSQLDDVNGGIGMVAVGVGMGLVVGGAAAYAAYSLLSDVSDAVSEATGNSDESDDKSKGK